MIKGVGEHGDIVLTALKDAGGRFKDKVTTTQKRIK